MIRHPVDAWLVGPGTSLDESVLSADEQLRAARMRSPHARRRFVRGRAALRTILAAGLDCGPAEIVVDESDRRAPRPRPDRGLHVGLAHAADVVLVALSRDRPVGVDVEVVGARRRPVPAVALTPGKLASVETLLAPEHGPLGTWVAQEAALKVDGTGLAQPLAEVTFEPAPGQNGLLRVSTGAGEAYLVALGTVAPSIVMAIALRGASPAVVLHDRRGGDNSTISTPWGPAGRRRPSEGRLMTGSSHKC